MNDNNPIRYHLDEAKLRDDLKDSALAMWTDALIKAVHDRGNELHHGRMPKWQAALDALPTLPITKIDLDHELGVSVLTDVEVAADQLRNNDSVTDFGSHKNSREIVNEYASEKTSEHVSEQAQALEPALKELMPWRKGPYRIAHVCIDTEWRSDWKWNRVYPHISPLQNRTVLDVGCGSGYHMWRMRAQGAKTVLGIDPLLLFPMQFQAIQHYINDPNVGMLPLTMETLPENMQLFDTVFSMGVLYHRRDPHAHLQELMQTLTDGGELVLETLVSLGEEATALDIDGRYARMRNIWTLPSVPLLARWIKDAGFINIRCVSVDITSRLEQRTTEWMPHESLIESLDPEDLSRTVEGHPRPRRAVMIATKPD